MQYTAKTLPLASQKSDCLIIGLYLNKQLTPSAKALDELSQGALKKIIQLGDISGNIGETLMLYHLPHIKSPRVLLVGCGKKSELDTIQWCNIIRHTSQALQQGHVKEACCYLTDIVADPYRGLRHAIETTAYTVYRFTQLKSEKKPLTLKKIVFNIESKQLKEARNAVRDAACISQGVALARTLGNLPANICTPTYLANQAKKIAREHKKIKLNVLDEKAMKKLGMNALLSVSRGSAEGARLICLHYQGARNKTAAPYVFVGKGITFDSGGISLKSAPGMDEMKFDMCGAASVLGLMETVSQLNLPLNVIGVIASAENLPGGKASKPGDIVKSLSGQTIEILNTDAEGRLVLCDALTYCERFKPKSVVDIATLTGAMAVGLGTHPAGLLSNDDKLSRALQEAGTASGDRVWPMPLWDEYKKELDSNFADMANVGGRWGGGLTAAGFLSRFTQNFAWAHLDIAGIAWLQGAQKGATGRPVTLLVEYLLKQR